MSLSYSYDLLGSVWYYSEPSEGLYSPKTTFGHFLQQTGSRAALHRFYHDLKTSSVEMVCLLGIRIGMQGVWFSLYVVWNRLYGCCDGSIIVNLWPQFEFVLVSIYISGCHFDNFVFRSGIGLANFSWQLVEMCKANLLIQAKMTTKDFLAVLLYGQNSLLYLLPANKHCDSGCLQRHSVKVTHSK